MAEEEKAPGGDEEAGEAAAEEGEDGEEAYDGEIYERYYRPIGTITGLLCSLLAVPFVAVGIGLYILWYLITREKEINPEDPDTEMTLLYGCANDKPPTCNIWPFTLICQYMPGCGRNDDGVCCLNENPIARICNRCSTACMSGFARWLNGTAVSCMKMPLIVFTYFAWKTEC